MTALPLLHSVLCDRHGRRVDPACGLCRTGAVINSRLEHERGECVGRPWCEWCVMFGRFRVTEPAAPPPLAPDLDLIRWIEDRDHGPSRPRRLSCTLVFWRRCPHRDQARPPGTG